MGVKVPLYTLLTVLTVDLLATSGDISMTWTSPTLTKLSSNDSDVNPLGRPITRNEESWIGSLVTLGAMVGPFPYGWLVKNFGRKNCLLCIAIPHMIAYLIYAFSHTIYLYYLARILNGLAIGGGYAVLPMYISEVAEDSNRGRFCTTLNIFWAIGNLVPYCVGPYLTIFWFNIINACFPVTFFIIFFFTAPETPYYLTMMNKTNKAEKVLMKLRSQEKDSIELEMKQIEIELQENTEEVSLADFFRTKTYMKGLIISVVIIIVQQLSGVDVVLFYTEEIFAEAGATSLRPEVSAMILGFIGFCFSFTCPIFADKAGRRILLLLSLLGITTAHTVFGTYFYLKDSTKVDVSSISWLPIVSLIGYVVSFNVGMATLPWTISSELFPTSVKPYAASLVSCVCWTTSFIVTKSFNDCVDSIGLGGTFWLFGGFCAVAWFFTFFFIPETKGKSFQEIQEMLDS